MRDNWLELFARYCRREAAEGAASPATQEKYLRLAKKFLAWLDDRPFTREEIVEYRALLLRRQYQPATVRLHLQVVKLLARVLQEAGEIPGDPRLLTVRAPRERVSPAEKRVFLTAEEAQRVLSVAAYGNARNDYFRIRRTLMIALMLIEGARTIEVARLREEDISLPERLIRFRGKRHDRFVELDDGVETLLTAWLPLRSGPWVFPSSRRAGAPLSPRRIRGIVVEVLDEAGVRFKARGRVSAHSLRHTFASLALASGADLVAIKEAGGWRSLTSVEIYLHSLPSPQGGAVRRIPLRVPVAAIADNAQSPEGERVG
jgi:integrase